MSEHFSAQRIEQYRQRSLSAVELIAADDHLAKCEDCRLTLITAFPVETIMSEVHARLRIVDADLKDSHLSYEELVALVDGEIDQIKRELLQGHLEICASCREDADDLRAFRLETLEAQVAEPEIAAQATVREKVHTLIRVIRTPWRPAVIATLAMLLISASIGLFFVWRTRRAEPMQQTTQSGQVNTVNTNNIGPSPSPLPATDTQFVQVLNDGGRQITLDSEGNVGGIDGISSASKAAVRQALTTGRIDAPDLSELIGRKGTLLGPAGEGTSFSLISPLGTITRSVRPTFRWRPLSGATSYTVSILDNAFKVITSSEPLTTTTWTPGHALQRGRVYSWQVTAMNDGKSNISPSPPEPEARFKVLDRALEDELSNAERARSSYLVRGTLYASAGLLEEAEEELRALDRENPNSPIAHQLLQSIRAIKNRYKSKQ